jgi:hypothetical protein
MVCPDDLATDYANQRWLMRSTRYLFFSTTTASGKYPFLGAGSRSVTSLLTKRCYISQNEYMEEHRKRYGRRLDHEERQ